MKTASVRARDIKAGDRCPLGYIVAVTPAARQRPDGSVISSGRYLTLYLRTKPMSPRGKICGVDNGTYDMDPDEPIIVFANTPGDAP